MRAWVSSRRAREISFTTRSLSYNYDCVRTFVDSRNHGRRVGALAVQRITHSLQFMHPCTHPRIRPRWPSSSSPLRRGLPLLPSKPLFKHYMQSIQVRRQQNRNGCRGPAARVTEESGKERAGSSLSASLMSSPWSKHCGGTVGPSAESRKAKALQAGTGRTPPSLARIHPRALPRPPAATRARWLFGCDVSGPRAPSLRPSAWRACLVSPSPLSVSPLFTLFSFAVFPRVGMKDRVESFSFAAESNIP